MYGLAGACVCTADTAQSTQHSPLKRTGATGWARGRAIGRAPHGVRQRQDPSGNEAMTGMKGLRHAPG